MPTAYLVQTTIDSQTAAENVAQSVVAAKLCACAQVIPGIKSIYRWQGQMENANEWLIQFKTLPNFVSDLIAHIKSHHSYETPEIIAIPIEQIDSDYEKWMVATQTVDSE